MAVKHCLSRSSQSKEAKRGSVTRNLVFKLYFTEKIKKCYSSIYIFLTLIYKKTYGKKKSSKNTKSTKAKTLFCISIILKVNKYYKLLPYLICKKHF